MSYTLNTKAFFFNAKTDYLPYYKHFKLTLPRDAVAKDILVAIQAQNENFAYPELNLVFKINDVMVEEDLPLASIVEKLGTELQIDPASSYRANNGLIINNHDFMQSFDILAPFATESDKKYYKTLYALHYASETTNFDKDYIGDAVLVLAHKMISEGNAHPQEILDAITSVHSGLLDCEYENNLFNAQSYDAAITALKDMGQKKDDDEHLSLIERIKARLGSEPSASSAPQTEKTNRTAKTIENLEEKQIAYYAGADSSRVDAISHAIASLETKEIEISRKYKLAGTSILKDNPTLAYKKAGAILLNAFDAGTEVLVVEDVKSYEIFTQNFKAIESTIGRKIIGMELMLADDFVAQASTVAA